MANTIKGNQDGKNGENITYTIPGRGSNIARKIIVNEIKKGLHPNHTTTKINGKEYAKAKPNNLEKDNVNKE